MNRRHFTIAGATAAAGSTIALAQDSGSPESMDQIQFPIDLASLALQISAAGATVLVTVFTVAIGFAMVKKLKGRLTRSV